MTDAELLEAARRWAAADPDAETAAELHALLDDPAGRASLADRFAGALEFGTAGLRGVLGAGPNRMNRAVVIRTTWGMARYLEDTIGGEHKRPVVIGYDGRRLSRELAEETAAVLCARSIPTFLFDDVVPTPLLAFAVVALECVAGVMITASHNPPEYNGYKAYWSNGAQIVPPIDVGIARAIEQAPVAKDVARADLGAARRDGLLRAVPVSVERAYLDGVSANAASPSSEGKDMAIVYTPLHGVGDRLARVALAEAGFRRVTSVPEQAAPDGAFPTVRFPNPEEPGAMDLAFALARDVSADIVFANDPDADRLAVGIPDPSVAAGYRMLSGNQVGVLLGDKFLRAAPAKDRALVITSIVSSPMLGVMARSIGAHYEETLTGFKWIANRAIDLERMRGLDFLFGYEEALGYTVGTLVRDKDGISALVAFAELAAALRARGTTVAAHLESLYREHGLFVSSQVNITRGGADGAREIARIMAGLRSDPPLEIAGLEVHVVRDFERQETRARGATVEPIALPPSNVLAYELEGGSRVIARPSGTEPKCKFYFDVRAEVGADESMAKAAARAQATLAALEAALKARTGT